MGWGGWGWEKWVGRWGAIVRSGSGNSNWALATTTTFIFLFEWMWSVVWRGWDEAVVEKFWRGVTVIRNAGASGGFAPRVVMDPKRATKIIYILLIRAEFDRFPRH